MSKSQNVSIEASFYIYDKPLTERCDAELVFIEFADKILIFAVLKQWLLQG